MQKKIAILMIVNLLLFSIVGISYGETGEKSITYNEAVNRALDASDAIEDLSDSMEDVWEQKTAPRTVAQRIIKEWLTKPQRCKSRRSSETRRQG